MTILELVQENYMVLLAAMGKTLQLTLLSLIFASVIGLVFGVLNVSKKKVCNVIATIYIDAVRGVPLIVMAYFIYFGLPPALKSVGLMAESFKLGAMPAGIIALSLNAGAYMAEIVRAGIQSVDIGQMEASRSLGLPYGKSMIKVILPQAIRTMIPSIINQFIITLKDTSILSVIGFPELTKAGNIIIGRNFEVMKMWLIIGIMYLIVITILSKLAKALERRTAYGK